MTTDLQAMRNLLRTLDTLPTSQLKQFGASDDTFNRLRWAATLDDATLTNLVELANWRGSALDNNIAKRVKRMRCKRRMIQVELDKATASGDARKMKRLRRDLKDVDCDVATEMQR